MDRKAERTAKFNRNQQAKHKQKNKKAKRKYSDDVEDTRIPWDTNRLTQRERPE